MNLLLVLLITMLNFICWRLYLFVFICSPDLGIDDWFLSKRIFRPEIWSMRVLSLFYFSVGYFIFWFYCLSRLMMNLITYGCMLVQESRLNFGLKPFHSPELGQGCAAKRYRGGKACNGKIFLFQGEIWLSNSKKYRTWGGTACIAIKTGRTYRLEELDVEV